MPHLDSVRRWGSRSTPTRPSTGTRSGSRLHPRFAHESMPAPSTSSTEDVLRMQVVDALLARGVPPEHLEIEAVAAELPGARIDLVVRGDDGRRAAAIELKFPRDARGPISPDTMTYGEMVRDFHRMTMTPADEHWVVQVVNHRLAAYIARFANRGGLPWPVELGGRVTWTSQMIALLPATARDAVQGWRDGQLVQITCVSVADLGELGRLFVGSVAGPHASPLGLTPARSPSR